MKSGRRPKRIRRRASGIVFALSLGGLVMGLAAVIIAVRPREVQSKPATDQVRIAGDFDMVLIPTPTRAIARGEKLGDVSFAQVQWPKNKLSDNYITDIDEFKNAVAKTALPKYLPIPTSAISAEALDKNAVVEGIPEGMRAITVRVDEEAAVEGWARSGNYVDVILIRSAPDNFTGLEAKVIAEKVKILSVEGSTTPGPTGGSSQKLPRTITLLTSQEEALKIKTASNIGKLNFALRGSGDESPTITTAMDQRKLLGSSQPSRDKKSFRGFAKGPDGKVYVLSGEESRWLHTPEVPGEAPESFFGEHRAQLTSPEAPRNTSEDLPTEVPEGPQEKEG